MVFSSVPLYLDPHNWHHQQQAHLHQQQSQQLIAGHGGGDNTHPHLQPHSHDHQTGVHMPPPPPPVASQAAGGSSSIRPGSMADRARQAKIPLPETGLKCPRCESTNTKFCYFNNYSLTQPRHFCKTCRRYWTRGGALRNVPVGGGCRRNKQSGNKTGGGSKPAVGDQDSNPNNNNNSNNKSSTSPISSNILEDTTFLPQTSFHQPSLAQFPLLASLQGLTAHGQYGSPPSSLGLSFGGMMSAAAAQAELGFQLGGSNDSSNNHPCRPHHFPNFLAGFDPLQPSSVSNLYQFSVDHHHQATLPPPRSLAVSQQPIRPLNNSATHDHQQGNEAAVKAEEAAAGQREAVNLVSRSFLGMSDHNSNRYWSGNNNNNNRSSNNSTWTDLSGLNSSTTSLL